MIAQKFGVSYMTISRRLFRMGVNRRVPGPVPIDLPMDEIVERYKQGETLTSIADSYYVSRSCITDRLKAAGVPIKVRGLPLPGRREMYERRKMLRDAGLSLKEIAEIEGVTEQSIWQCLNIERKHSFRLPQLNGRAPEGIIREDVS